LQLRQPQGSSPLSLAALSMAAGGSTPVLSSGTSYYASAPGVGATQAAPLGGLQPDLTFDASAYLGAFFWCGVLSFGCGVVCWLGWAGLGFGLVWFN
jgi:hypothetical protein